MAFGDNCLTRASDCDWYNLFKKGWERVDDEPRSGRPSTSTSHRGLTEIIRDLTGIAEISKGSVKIIFKDHLSLRKVKKWLYPKSLNFFEKQLRVNVCKTMLSDRMLWHLLWLATCLGSTITIRKRPKSWIEAKKKKITSKPAPPFALRIPSDQPNCQQGILLGCY